MNSSRGRVGMSKADHVANLLRKTIENGATAGEEASAIQLAHMLVRQHGLDMDAFRLALDRIGDPPRYIITRDGFLMPAAARVAEAPPRRPAQNDDEEQPAQSEPGPERECSHSPTGRHRMEQHMRGTLPTGASYCIHCGLRG